jgi:predicted dehydrogenase
MEEVRIGIVGLGMGGLHARNILEGRVPRATLGAVCDLKPERLAAYPDIPKFTRSMDLVRSGAVDAVLVATPHYSHPDVALEALAGGLHVMVEKPIAVHKAEAVRLLAGAPPGGPVLAVMLN